MTFQITNVIVQLIVLIPIWYGVNLIVTLLYTGLHHHEGVGDLGLIGNIIMFPVFVFIMLLSIFASIIEIISCAITYAQLGCMRESTAREHLKAKKGDGEIPSGYTTMMCEFVLQFHLDHCESNKEREVIIDFSRINQLRLFTRDEDDKKWILSQRFHRGDYLIRNSDGTVKTPPAFWDLVDTCWKFTKAKMDHILGTFFSCSFYAVLAYLIFSHFVFTPIMDAMVYSKHPIAVYCEKP